MLSINGLRCALPTCNNVLPEVGFLYNVVSNWSPLTMILVSRNSTPSLLIWLTKCEFRLLSLSRSTNALALVLLRFHLMNKSSIYHTHRECVWYRCHLNPPRPPASPTNLGTGSQSWGQSRCPLWFQRSDDSGSYQKGKYSPSGIISSFVWA